MKGVGLFFASMLFIGLSYWTGFHDGKVAAFKAIEDYHQDQHP